MITPRTILRDSALAIPLLVPVGYWFEGALGALAVVASGLVALGNLALLAWLVHRVMDSATQGGGGGAVLLVMGKLVIVLCAYAALLSLFPPLGVALGLGAAVLGLSARGTIEALRIPSATPAEEA
ncbi:MAG: hypothetical protein JRJ84_16230 [Deltaproteobacteria bacterium]|nr:hypothetical protein [Deltaproteobacteria bacterium]